MSNNELLVTLNMQTSAAAQEIRQLTESIAGNGGVLPHDDVGKLNTIVTRLGQAHSAGISLQARAHGEAPPKNG